MIPMASRARTISDEPGPVAESVLAAGAIVLEFLTRHADQYRHAYGTPTDEYDNFRDTLKPLRQLYKDIGNGLQS